MPSKSHETIPLKINKMSHFPTFLFNQFRYSRDFRWLVWKSHKKLSRYKAMGCYSRPSLRFATGFLVFDRPLISYNVLKFIFFLIKPVLILDWPCSSPATNLGIRRLALCTVYGKFIARILVSWAPMGAPTAECDCSATDTNSLL
jgi:hypothetical protein